MTIIEGYSGVEPLPAGACLLVWAAVSGGFWLLIIQLMRFLLT
jgi:hypothetical protein